MILIDANLLIYAYNARASEHAAAREWLERVLNTSEFVMLPWITVWAFVRLATNARAFPGSYTPQEALNIVRDLLSQPNVRIPEPGPQHAHLLQACMTAGQVTGPRTTDAVLAALAIEHGATLASTDRDFTRFSGLKWISPIEPSRS